MKTLSVIVIFILVKSCTKFCFASFTEDPDYEMLLLQKSSDPMALLSLFSHSQHVDNKVKHSKLQIKKPNLQVAQDEKARIAEMDRYFIEKLVESFTCHNYEKCEKCKADEITRRVLD